MNVISEELAASGDRAAPHSVWSVVWCHSAGCSEATGVGVVGAVGTALLCSALLWNKLVNVVVVDIFTVSSRTSH